MELPGSSGAPCSPALFFGRTAELERYAGEMPRVRLAVVYGPGGVGKSAFALRASEELARAAGARLAWVRCRPHESASTLAASAVASIAGETSSQPVARLLALGPLVLVIDDAHLADPGSVVELAEYLVTRNRAIHVCAASRAELPFSPVAVDHLVIKLAGLDREAAAALWAGLVSLYGPARRAPGSDGHGRLAGGNPLLIKRAFAADPVAGDDSLGLGELTPLEQSLLVDLCTLRAPALRSSLSSAGQDPVAVDGALRALERRFLVETRDGWVGVHDLIRDAVARSPWRAGPDTHARLLERFRSHPPGDEAALVELLYHAVAAHEDQLAVERLRAELDEPVRIPRSSAILDREIRDAIDRLAERRELPIELQVLRARVRARQGEVGAALAALDELPGTSVVEPDRAELAYMLGRVDRALASAERVLADASASPLAHARAIALAVEAARMAGDVPRALEMAERVTAPLELLGPLRVGLRAWARAVTFTDCERYVDAAAELETARRVLAEVVPLAAPMLGPLESALSLLVGKAGPESEDADKLFDGNLFFRCLARLLRAQEHLARGRVRRAAEIARQTWDTGEKTGLVPVASWAAWIWAEAACALGEYQAVIERVPPMVESLLEAKLVPPRVRLTLSLAEALLASGQVEPARALIAGAYQLAAHFPRSRARAEALAARAGGVDLTGQAPAAAAGDLCGFGAAEALLASAELALERGDLAAAGAAADRTFAMAMGSGWRGLACRAGLVSAEHDVRIGALEAAGRALDEHGAPARELGLHGAQAHAEALTVALARAQGREEPAVTDRLRRTRAFLRLHLDAPMAVEIATHTGRIFLPRARLDEVELPADCVVDLVRGWARWAGSTVDLSRRLSLLSLLATLAAPPGTWLTPADLAERAWQLDYHPLKHHSRLAMAVARLRGILGETTIESSRNGYRLPAAGRWAVVRPCDPM